MARELEDSFLTNPAFCDCINCAGDADNDVTTGSETVTTEMYASVEFESQVHTKDKLQATTMDNDTTFYDKFCEDYMKFTDNNPTTAHVVSYFSDYLNTSGFQYLSEKREFNISEEGGAYYTTRGGVSLVAFLIGKNWKPQNGVGVIGSHVDCLTAKLKPCSLMSKVHGYELLGVASYSGSLNHLWLDRDLGIAGTILVRDKLTNKVECRLVSSGNRSVCRIPSLAPHFGDASNLPYNKETQMVPVMGFGADDISATEDEKACSLYGKHSLSLLRYISKLAQTDVSQILQMDLELFDVQPATRGGLSNEFMFAPRIDDRLCSYSAIHGLTLHARGIDFKNSDEFSIVFLANNEEIGSGTRTGAKAKFLNSVVERALSARGYSISNVLTTFANSIILSADVTHALNPNFEEAYLKGHFPLPNRGLTIKLDANGHVMTDSIGVLVMELISNKNGLTLQKFHIRNDKPSGGTIGPMLAVDTGARVVDVGLAQLSMHSIRAAAGYKEVGIGVETFKAFFDCWRTSLDCIEYN